MAEASVTRNLRICYGYRRDGNGQITIDSGQGQIVKLIFEKYLGGYSLGRVQSFLRSINITSPSGKDAWTRAALDKILSNKSYVPRIISAEQFDVVQAEKQRRSNVQQENNQSFRKSTRYNSTNMLSGLLVCEECGANYRRITKQDGAIVWRCANRVEHGKRICRHSPTVSEASILEILSRQFEGVPPADIAGMRNNLGRVIVSEKDGLRTA